MPLIFHDSFLNPHSPKHIFIDFLILTQRHFFIASFFFHWIERERDGERDIDVREKHQWVAFSYAPRLGIEPKTRMCALTGN